MPEVGERVYPTTPREWHDWMAANHATAEEIWLVMYTVSSGRPFVRYNEALDEALCFGWIDGVVKSLGDGARAQRYTPRRPGSNVSEMNKAHVRRLIAEGRMTQAGIDALSGFDEWIHPPPLVVPDDIERALRAGGAWENFCAMSDQYRRIRIAYVDHIRDDRPEEFAPRLANLVNKTAAGKQFGGFRDPGY